jgi:hypothetical protein
VLVGAAPIAPRRAPRARRGRAGRRCRWRACGGLWLRSMRGRGQGL